MTIVKSNICKMCGGLLDIDIDRQVYICPFCGVTFDYEYFREDNVLKLAKTAMRRREFGSARDAYEYMLKKDPHNFEALRGVLLCKCKWTNMNPMLKIGEVHLTNKEPALINAVENCLPEHKDYFFMIEKAVDLLSDYKKSRADLANLERDRLTAQKKLQDIEHAREINRTRFTTAWGRLVEQMATARRGDFVVIPIYFGFFMILGLGYATIVGEQYWIPAVIAAILLTIAIIYNIRKSMVDKRLIVSREPVIKKMQELDSSIDAKRTELDNCLLSYKKLAGKIITTYPMDDGPVQNETARKIFKKGPFRFSRVSSDFPKTRKME